MLFVSKGGHEFISILYCQVPPSKNKVDYYYYYKEYAGQQSSEKFSNNDRNTQSAKEEDIIQLSNQRARQGSTFVIFRFFIWLPLTDFNTNLYFPVNLPSA